jgi:predicted dehydrogenase
MNNAAIIGCGNIGCELSKYKPGLIITHLEAYKKLGVKVIGVCDIDIEKAKRYSKNAFSNYKDLLRQKPTIVSVCTPDDTHYEILKEITKHSSIKGIWAEKPFTKNLKQADEIIKICKKKKIKLMVNHFRRYDDFYISVKKKMGLLGKIQRVVCYYSGGIVTVGSHLLDLLDLLFGRCQSVDGLHLKFKGFYVDLIPVKGISIMEIDIMGDEGRLDLISKPFGRYDYRFYKAKKDKIGTKYFDSIQKEIFSKDVKRDFFEKGLKDLIKSIKENKEPISSAVVSRKSLELICAISYSIKHKKSVKLPFKNKKFMIPKAQGDIKKWENQQS